MKKLTNVLALAVLVLGLGMSQATFASTKDDIKAVKKADNISEAKWFKVVVIDTKTNKEKVKVTLPLSLVEIFADAANENSVCMGNMKGLDLKKLFAELKKVGPLAMVEVFEEGEHVKVWLE